MHKNTFIAPNLKLSKFTFITINLVQYFISIVKLLKIVYYVEIYIIYNFISVNVSFSYKKLSTKNIPEATF